MLDLDADVETYLAFGVRNPNFFTVPITMRMLLTHTSSLLDSEEIDGHLVDGDSPITLAELMEGYVTPGGAYYRPEQWDENGAPGTAYTYSNSGASLAAYVVEAIAGRTYAEEARAGIFTPLGMTNTSFRLVDLDPGVLATPYGGTERQGYTTYGQYGYPDYPDGLLRTSVNDYARFVEMFLAGGTRQGTTVLQTASTGAIASPQVPAIDPTQGLIFYSIDYAGRTMLGHNGAYLGASADVYFDLSDGTGFIVLTNGDTYLYGSNAEAAAFDRIERRLLEESLRF
jgi:CubicO group peptidase (beta-lactamase class C family)